MAELELVIKIPEETVKDIKDNAMFAGTISSEILWDVTSAIANGTPLDKHDEEVIAETVKSIWGKPPYRDMLDKIYADIQRLRGCSCSCSDGIIDDIEDIIDKYRGEV